jgi:hypothetical protein
MNEYRYYRRNTRYRVSRSQYLGAQRANRTLAQTHAGGRDLSQAQAQRADRTLEELEDAIIHVLLQNTRENGRHACMRPSDIGREIGTYRRHAPSSDDTFGRVHHKLLRKLQNKCRVEPLWNESGKKRIGWRLTETE